MGFRPFVYRLANELGLAGWVNNDSLGVTVEVQGSAEALAMFSRRLGEELPPLASIDSCERGDAPVVAGEESFVIRPSEQGELATAQVTVDTAVCDDCLREMRDERDPRFAYPFINCTNCGPRYTIVRRIPYDRPNTTMASFVMCPLCRGEYDNREPPLSRPADRLPPMRPRSVADRPARQGHRRREPGRLRRRTARRGEDPRDQGPGRLSHRLPRR